ncbi:MAG: type I DNA topoisomerase [Candidatus Pacebacteria bacterium]|nr:type I DNA topoisomerase [Candidatus Paceibacterota bacterium]
MKNLVIVESPTKAKTISRFLGKDFTVESSNGHVRDLPKGNLGIDLENDFKPKYVIPKKSEKQVNLLKKAAKTAERVILATDEDREGEAIAWHLIQALNLNEQKKKSKKTASAAVGQKTIERIAFHEITKSAIEEALKNPRALDINLVNAQQARRILDRLVGYKLSPFLWKKLMRGLSAGRVQSVALRLIVEREKEIKDFIPQDYWLITVIFKKEDGQKEEFEGFLVKIDEKAVPKPGFLDGDEVDGIIDALKNREFKITDIEKKSVERTPRPPFTTSTLQQAAWQRLKFSAKRTMMLAQQLYEGIDLKKEGGHVGLITYMRTDSLNIAESALVQASDFIKNSFGEKYGVEKYRRFKTKSKGAQEAHEAIRPTHPHLSPDSIKNDLNPSQHKLYSLIWQRFIACQMANAVFEDTNIKIEANGEDGKNYLFQSKGSILKFDGFLKVYPVKAEEKILPEISKTDKISAKEIIPDKHQTQPPARFNDASIVKELEKNGIGRPSTYAQIISTIETRNYVERDEQKRFVPTEIGEKVNGILVEHFPKIVDINFTAKMESDLDDIAEGKTEYPPIVKEFYEPFEKNLLEKYESVEKEDLTEPTDEVCKECGKPMVIKHGRFGRFLACSGFPDCKNTKPLPPKSLNMKCPLCKEGDVVERKTRRGKIFYGCSLWPNCKFATWQKPTGELCPECKSPLVELKSGIKCSNKECGYKK